MTQDQVSELMQNELKCVQTAAAEQCDRDCAKCPLVKPDSELIEAYNYVIDMLLRNR